MARHDIELEFAAVPADVWAVVADVARWGDWDPSIRTIEAEPGTPGGVGARYAVTVGFYGRAIEQTHEIVRADEPHHLVVESTGRATGRWDLELEPHAGGTRLRWTTTLKLGGLARVLDKGLDLALAGLVENAADGLRRRVEGSAAR